MDDLSDQLPVELFENRDIFDQVVGPQLIRLLSRTRLDAILEQHLPSTITGEEKRQTLHLLLNNQLTHFEKNPLDVIFMRLKLQTLSPDLLRTLEEVRELKAKALRLEEQKLQCKLLNEVMLRRKNALEQMLNSSSSDLPMPLNAATVNSSNSSKHLMQNVCSRYRKEMKLIKQEFGSSSSSSDECELNKLLESTSKFTII
jgi:hypothetical protein